MPSYGPSATVADSALDDIVGTNANDVHADQSTEIDRMQQMLDALPQGSGDRP